MANVKGSARLKRTVRAAAPTERTCKYCKEAKPLEQFSTHGRICADCKAYNAQAAINRARAALAWGALTPKQKARRKAAMKRYQKKLRAARSRAKRPEIARMRGPTRLALLGDSGDNNI